MFSTPNLRRSNRTHLIRLPWSAVLPILIASLHYGCVHHHQAQAVAVITVHQPIAGRGAGDGSSRRGDSNQHEPPYRHNDTHIFTSDTFPATDEFRPSLANGHLGFTVFGDTVYMNGLYNGRSGLSHRARVPNWAMVRMATTGCDAANGCRTEFRLNVRQAVFEEEQWHGDRFRSVHRVYAHRVYTRAIVNEFFVYRLNYTGVVRVQLQRIDGNASTSEDISFGTPSAPAWPLIGLRNHGVTSRCGYTNEAEDPAVFNHDDGDADDDCGAVAGCGASAAGSYGGHRSNDGDDNSAAGGDGHDGRQSVCVLWTRVPEEITLGEDVQVMSARFVMTADGRQSVAEQEMMDVLKADENELFTLHRNAWSTFWSEFGITVAGDLELSRTIDASLFALATSLPASVTNQPANAFGGLSPTGLPKGGSRLDDYEGHSMWDTEIWMFPVLLLMNPVWTESLLDYRHKRLEAARTFAKTTGHKGARFPWESAHTGRDVTQPCCPLVARHQVHVSADIAFAVRNHFAATGDTSWLLRVGCPMAKEIAAFWASRVTFNGTSRMYDVNDVMGPDEDHDGVSNNAYTNVAVGLALYFADFSTCICDQLSARPSTSSLPTPQSFSAIAAHLKLPYDAQLNYTPQFDGYARDTIIKQADTVLVGYPLLYSGLSPGVQSNNVAYYERLTRHSGPAMTWSMHAVNRLQLMRAGDGHAVGADRGGVDDDRRQADAMFRRGYQGYVRAPFMVWNEVQPTEPTGAINFLTGAGGFLQSVINGYAGLKLRLDGLHIERPRLPERVHFLSLTGIRYLGSKFRLDIQRDTRVLLECVGPIEAAGGLLLRMANGTEVRVAEREQYDITQSAITTIRALVDVHRGCPLPRDLIGDAMMD